MNPSLLLMLSMVAGNPPTMPVPPNLPANYPTCGPNGGPRLPGQPCPPYGPPAPVLAVRFLAPEGVMVQYLPGSGNTFATPSTVGMRPGYRYVAALGNLPGRNANEMVYPVVEVFGSLVPRAGMNVMEYAAPVALNRMDIDRALAGTMVTKYIYLEDPTKAVPIEAKPDQPLEFSDLTERDAEAAAKNNGRLVAIVRVGDRSPDADLYASFNLPGTMLLPGSNALGIPKVGPCLPFYGVPLFDAVIGYKPTPEECLTDGGDKGPRLGIGPAGRLGGLNPTDVSLEFTANRKRRVATSNEVCICAPRFVIRKVEAGPSGLQMAVALDAAVQTAPIRTASMNLLAGATLNRIKPLGLESRMRPAITFVVNGLMIFEGVTRPYGISTIAGVQQSIGVIEPDEITSNPDQFVVHKSVEPVGPVKSGDIVTFTLNYRNSTVHPATDIILSDSLSGRLEYVPGSAQSDRPANVTTLDNEAGSVVLRFEIPGPIPPGKTGVVKFRAKVR